MFLPVLDHPGSLGQRAVKGLLLSSLLLSLSLLFIVCAILISEVLIYGTC